MTRLALALVLFLAAQLTWVRAPTHSLWKLSIVVLEGGYLLAIPCLILVCWSFGKQPFGNPAAFLFLLAAVFFSSPLIRAMQTASKLERAFAAGFGKTLPAARIFHRWRPLMWKELLFGIHSPAVIPREMTYTDKDTGENKLDFYPANRKHAPCVIVIHAGGWDSGDRKQLTPLNDYLSSLGYAVAAIDYRLAPLHIYPAPVDDVREALAFLRKNAAILDIDASRMVLLGRSSGAQIALQAAYTLRDPAVRGVISFYGPADMVFGYSIPGNPLLLDSRLLLDHYLGAGYFQDPAKYVASSPIEALNASSPPTLLLHGHPDVLVSFEHTRRMEAKLTRLGVDHFTVDLPWATHAYDYVFFGPGSQISLYFIERFLARVCATRG